MAHPIEAQDNAEVAAEVLKAVANPLRLRIVAVLCQTPLSVGELAERLRVAQPLVSQQLRILRMRNLVGATRTGGRSVYRLTEPHLRQMLGCLTGCVCPDAAADER